VPEENPLLLDCWWRDVYSHHHSLTGTADPLPLSRAGSVTEYQSRFQFVAEEPPLLAHFFASLSNSCWQSYHPLVARDILQPCPQLTLTTACERLEDLSTREEERKTFIAAREITPFSQHWRQRTSAAFRSYASGDREPQRGPS
jgi:hypothetical protein